MSVLHTALGWEGVLIALSVLGMGMASLAEGILLGVNPWRVRALAAAGSPGARRLERLLARPERSLTSLLTGIHLSVILGAVAAALLTARAGSVVPDGRWPWAALAGTALLLILARLTARGYATHRPEAVALRLATLIEGVTLVLSPCAVLFQLLAAGAARLLGAPRSPTSSRVTPSQVRLLLDRGEEQGALEEDERSILDSILELETTSVREIMCPRTDMVCAPADASLRAIVQLMQESGYSRVPVYRESMDEVVGVAYVRDVLVEARRDSLDRPLWRTTLREPFFVPETKRISDLLREFRHLHTHMAIVVDEYGGTAGLVTLEDILEELVGEIQDEYDQEGPLLQPLTEDIYLVDPAIEADAFMERVGIDLPAGDYTSLGGFLLERAGRVPQAGQFLVCGCGRARLEFEILDVRNNRIASARVQVHRLWEADEAERVQIDEDGAVRVRASASIGVVERLLGVEMQDAQERLRVSDFLQQVVGSLPQPDEPVFWGEIAIESVEEEGYRFQRVIPESG